MAERRIEKFFKRVAEIAIASVPVALVLIPIAATMVLARLLANEAWSRFVVYGNPNWSVFGDALPILALFLLALHFRSRWCAAAATVLAYLWMLLRISALILYREALMGFDYWDLRLLWEHTDVGAIEAQAGKNCFLWLIPSAVMVAAAIAGAAWLTGRKLRDIGRRAMIVWKIFFWLLLILSATGIVRFAAVRSHHDPEEIYTGHLVRPLPVTAVFLVRDAFAAGRRDDGPAPLDDSSRKTLETMGLLPAPDAPAAPPAPARFDRIVIIALESLDLEFIGAMNPKMPAGVTPTLDRLCTEYPAMTNFFCSSQPTSWGLTGILLSRLDYDREVASPIRRGSLFSIASGRGYRSFYFSPITGVFADNRRTYGEKFSPERQYFLEEWTRKYGLRRDASWGLSDRTLYSGVLKVLRTECGSRFVVLISTMDTHHPYTTDGISEADAKRFPTPFLQALHMADRHLGEFLRELMADETLYNDRTLIVITADHTATHGENYLGRKEYVPERVPLIFVTPDREAFARLDRSKYASGIDLAPTLVGFVGGASPESFMGRSFFSDKNIAVSWMPGDILLVRSPKGEFRVSPRVREKDPEKQAVVDFFRSRH